MSNNYIPGQTAPVASVAGVPLSYAANIQLDFQGNPMPDVTLAGNISLTAGNHTAGKKLDVIVRSDASIRNLTFDSDWVFVGTKPTQIAASKVGLLELWSPTNLDAKVVARWTVQT